MPFYVDQPPEQSNWNETDTTSLAFILNKPALLKGDQGIGIKGSQGEPGEKGSDGSKGSVGDKGSDGSKGNESQVAGPKGSAGIKGIQGDSIQGDKGVQGESITGSKGEPSTVPGPKGNDGSKGSDGDSIKGDKGGVGERGQKGAKGEIGIIGITGSKGAKGELGLPGEKGIDGSKGPIGLTGSKGEKAENSKFINNGSLNSSDEIEVVYDDGTNMTNKIDLSALRELPTMLNTYYGKRLTVVQPSGGSGVEAQWHNRDTYSFTTSRTTAQLEVTKVEQNTTSPYGNTTTTTPYNFLPVLVNDKVLSVTSGALNWVDFPADDNTRVTGFSIDASHNLSLSQNDATTPYSVNLAPYLDNQMVTSGALNNTKTAIDLVRTSPLANVSINIRPILVSSGILSGSDITFKYDDYDATTNPTAKFDVDISTLQNQNKLPSTTDADKFAVSTTTANNWVISDKLSLNPARFGDNTPTSLHNESTFFGVYSGYGSNSSYKLTCFGYRAGESSNIGNATTCLGYRAGDNSNGNTNTFVGFLAGNNVVGSQNFALGEGSMDGGTMTSCIGIGRYAFRGATAQRSIGFGVNIMGSGFNFHTYATNSEQRSGNDKFLVGHNTSTAAWTTTSPNTGNPYLLDGTMGSNDSVRSLKINANEFHLPTTLPFLQPTADTQIWKYFGFLVQGAIPANANFVPAVLGAHKFLLTNSLNAKTWSDTIGEGTTKKIQIDQAFPKIKFTNEDADQLNDPIGKFEFEGKGNIATGSDLMANGSFENYASSFVLPGSGYNPILPSTTSAASDTTILTGWTASKPANANQNNVFIINNNNTAFGSQSQLGNHFIGFRGCSLTQNRNLTSTKQYILTWYEKSRTGSGYTLTDLTVKVNNTVESATHPLTGAWVQNFCIFTASQASCDIEFIAKDVVGTPDLNTAFLDNVTLYETSLSNTIYNEIRSNIISSAPTLRSYISFRVCNDTPSNTEIMRIGSEINGTTTNNIVVEIDGKLKATSLTLSDSSILTTANTSHSNGLLTLNSTQTHQILPDYSSQSDKFLKVNTSNNLEWGNVLPNYSGTSNQFLNADSGTLTWQQLNKISSGQLVETAGVTNIVLYNNNHTTAVPDLVNINVSALTLPNALPSYNTTVNQFLKANNGVLSWEFPNTITSGDIVGSNLVLYLDDYDATTNPNDKISIDISDLQTGVSSFQSSPNTSATYLCSYINSRLPDTSSALGFLFLNTNGTSEYKMPLNTFTSTILNGYNCNYINNFLGLSGGASLVKMTSTNTASNTIQGTIEAKSGSDVYSLIAHSVGDASIKQGVIGMYSYSTSRPNNTTGPSLQIKDDVTEVINLKVTQSITQESSSITSNIINRCPGNPNLHFESSTTQNSAVISNIKTRALISSSYKDYSDIKTSKLGDYGFIDFLVQQNNVNSSLVRIGKAQTSDTNSILFQANTLCAGIFTSGNIKLLGASSGLEFNSGLTQTEAVIPPTTAQEGYRLTANSSSGWIWSAPDVYYDGTDRNINVGPDNPSLGVDSISIGYYAGQLSTTRSREQSVFIGTRAGQNTISTSTDTGKQFDNVVMIGHQAGQNSQYMENCCAIGSNAGASVDANPHSNSNFIGYYAGHDSGNANTGASAYSNGFFGTFAGRNYVGIESQGFGRDALYTYQKSTTMRYRNNAIGSTSMRNCIGDDNCAQGSATLRWDGSGTLTAHRNIAIGSDAMGLLTNSACQNSNDNVFIGRQAGRQLSGNAVGNVSVGKNSGYQMVGNKNVMLGTQAGFQHNGSNCIYIGENQGYLQTESNKLKIGTFQNQQIISGTMNSTSATSELAFNAKRIDLPTSDLPTAYDSTKPNQIYIKNGQLRIGVDKDFYIKVSGQSTQTFGRSWTTYIFPTVDTDQLDVDGGSVWDSSVGHAVIQHDGLYFVSGTMRVKDTTTPENTNFAVAIHTSNVDSSETVWDAVLDTTNNYDRTTVTYSKIVRFTQDQGVRTIIYFDHATAQQMQTAQMVIYRLGD